MTTTKNTKAISADLNAALNHLAGISPDKLQSALRIQQMAAAGRKPGEAHPYGVWFGGCYYVEDEHGTKGRHLRYKLVACIA